MCCDALPPILQELNKAKRRREKSRAALDGMIMSWGTLSQASQTTHIESSQPCLYSCQQLQPSTGTFDGRIPDAQPVGGQ